ncbi:hypothetical protein [Actinomadura sp. DC4]|uniref:hypothetical protein n=1 Tax=Actinomadura sp. DC4 TaxID=3055069 RepID=UPI0025B2651E|nr:hypothetical protein [Actinomadura sp. DC4]MDN3355621.1 hypothetical protein [Actinomadura sp. DC4]
MSDNLHKASRTLDDVISTVEGVGRHDWTSSKGFGDDPLGLVVHALFARNGDQLRNDLSTRTTALSDHSNNLITMARNQIDAEQANVNQVDH